MSARFPNMIGIMRASIKTGWKTCEVPANKLCINVLRLFRDHGYIYGFNFVSPKKKSARLYPRVRIHFKYSDTASPVIRDLIVYKNTFSNFRSMRLNNTFQVLSQHKLYLLTTSKGLVLTSFTDMSEMQGATMKYKVSGKILLELFI